MFLARNFDCDYIKHFDHLMNNIATAKATSQTANYA